MFACCMDYALVKEVFFFLLVVAASQSDREVSRWVRMLFARVNNSFFCFSVISIAFLPNVACSDAACPPPDICVGYYIFTYRCEPREKFKTLCIKESPGWFR